MAQLTASLIRSAVRQINAGQIPSLTLWELYQLLSLAMGRVGTAEDVSSFPEFIGDKQRKVFEPSDTFVPPPAEDRYRLAMVMSGGGPSGSSTETRMEIAEVTAEQLRTLRMTQIGAGGGGSIGKNSGTASGNNVAGNPQMSVISSGGGGVSCAGAQMSSSTTGEVRADALFVKSQLNASDSKKEIPVPFKEVK